MIIDGVCIRWRGWIDLERLDGIGCLEYDEDRGRIEDAILREQIEQYKMRMREFEERQRLYKMAQAEHQKKSATVTSPLAGNISKSEVSKWPNWPLTKKGTPCTAITSKCHLIVTLAADNFSFHRRRRYKSQLDTDAFIVCSAHTN